MRSHAEGQERRIGARLLLAQTAVMVASLGTAALVAAVVGPPLFHRHLLEAGHTETSPELAHAEIAYEEASLLALAVAVLVAIVCSLLVSWYLSRRIQEPLNALAVAATDMAAGHYSVRLPEAGAGPELEAVASSFNAMAGRLEHTEDSRRRLLSDLGHEMRTPLSTIRAYLESLEDGVRTWDDDTRSVLRDQVDRLALLAADVSDVSAAEEGRLALQPQMTEVATLLGAAMDAHSDAFAARRVALVVEPPSTTCRIVADPARLGQVLSNLLTNALRHSPASSQVTVTASAVAGSARLQVADHGDGIPAEQLDHVFERFYRGDPARDRTGAGSGIGLTISKAIVEAHGGSIAVHSPGPGHGTTVTLTLPLAD